MEYCHHISIEKLAHVRMLTIPHPHCTLDITFVPVRVREATSTKIRTKIVFFDELLEAGNPLLVRRVEIILLRPQELVQIPANADRPPRTTFTRNLAPLLTGELALVS
jgi:hypothetical protein